MIAKLPLFCVDRRGAIVIATLVAALFASAFARKLPLDALPDLTNNQVIVLTAAPGLSPEELELTVTWPVEVALSGLAGLEETRSLSRYGISSVTAVFHDDVDPWLARQMVTERMQGVELAEGVESPQLAPLTGGLGEVFHITLSSPSRTPAELLELATLRVAPLLKSVQGVVEVNSWGGALRTMDVVARPADLAARNLTLDDLRGALESATGATPGGSLAAGESQVLVRAQARPREVSELAAAVVRESSATRVGDVADVREGNVLRLGAATANGRGETVYLMAQMLRDENALEVVQRVHGRMAAVRSALPADVRMEVVYDRSELVQRTLRTVGLNLLEGFGLVTVVLFAFLGSLRAGVVAASVIPLSMIFATAVMTLFKMPGNLMSLGALDFGLLVDGAVVMVEGAFHHVPGGGEHAWRSHVRKTAARSAKPVFSSVLVILLVYVPVLALTGTDGKLFRPMAITVVLALAFSLVLSLTWVPALLSLWLRREDVPQRAPIIVRLVERVYPVIIERLLPHRVPVFLAAVALLAAGVVTFRTRGVEFTPELDEGDLIIQTTRAPDVSLEAAVVAGTELEAALLAEIPEVHKVVSRIGSPAVATDIMGYEQADVFVSLHPRDRWRAGLTRDALVADMQHVLHERAPGSDPSFTQPIQMRFNELLGGAVTEVAVSVYGEDLVELRRLADALAASFEKVPGAADVRVLAPPAVPLLTVRPRPLDVAQYGLHAREVLDAAQAVRVGVPVGYTFDGALRIPLRLMTSGARHASELAMLPIAVRGGSVVPLSRLADVELSDAPGLVNRRNGQRRLVIGFNVRGADLASVVHGAQAEAARRVKLPPGYRLEWGGQYESLTAAVERLAIIVPIVLVLILSVLLFSFNRMRPALSVFSVVPIAAVGGIITLALRDLPISMPAAIGFIALSGIAVMNGVVWMSHALDLESDESLDPLTIARRAAYQRVRPVLMTALVAAMGFVPMMLSTGAGAEVQRPLATVVVGGIVTSTWLTLIVLPVLYPWLRSRRRPNAA